MSDIGTAYVRIAPNMTGIQQKIASGFNGLGGKFAGQFSNEFSAKVAVLGGAIAGVAQAAMQRAMSAISNSLGNAVSRVDTLARFPIVMQNLGHSADEARQQVERMSKSVIGLPTSLDAITSLAARLAPVSGSLTRATDVALAFNNAVLAGGGPTYRQADAIEQFSQMLSKGVPDMMAWRTLQEAMPATLSQTAKALGITSGNTLELFDGLQDGTITFGQFTDSIVNLNKEGLPGFKSFADQAKDSTSGIQTGIQNAQTAITRGIAKIITALGQKNVSEGIANIGRAFETALSAVATAVPPTLEALKNIFGFIGDNKDILAPIAVAIGAIIAAMKVWSVITTTAAVIQGAFNLALAANPIGLVVLALAGLVAGLTFFFTQTETGKSIIQSFGQVVSAVWDGIRAKVGSVLNTIIGASQSAWNSISRLWGNAGRFFTDVFNNIKNAFGGMANIGRNIVEGLWNGITGMGNWLKDKIINFVKDKIPGPIRDALGIRSPSKVAASLGEEISAGLAQGVYKKAGLVVGAVTSMANNATEAMASSSLTADIGASLRPSSAAGATAAASRDAIGAQIVQNNNIYNQVDLDSVSRQLAWQVRR